MSFLKNRTVVGVICILLSLLICFGLTPLFNQSVSQKAEIVRVVQPIRVGDEITESMVQTVEVGGYNLPEDVLRQKESAVGKYATADLAVGDYIIPSKLSDAPAAENAYLYSLDGSQQAISVSIKSFAEGLSGKLQSGDMLIDTVGMSTLFLPDLQYHFHGMDPNWVVNHAYNAASYILEHDNPIQDGETIDGVADGQMSREIQWKCQYEDALIQPPRGVLDIHMGNYASGGR